MDPNGEQYPDAFSDSEEEKDDFTIRKTDSIIVAATAENDHSNLEVYIYEHEASNLYVHHEIILASYPLCLEWLPVWGGEKTNMMIVGTFIPEIEIWNLDSENCEPVAVLGEYQDKDNQTFKKIKKQQKKTLNVKNPTHTHTDAVMCLSLNPFQREYLLSGSADKTIRVWDLDEMACKATYSSLHTDKVQAVRWNRQNEQLFVSGGFDGRLNIQDVRETVVAGQFTLNKAKYNDVEHIQWHPSMEHNLVVTTESGHMLGFDTRNFSKPIFEVKAHNKACSQCSFSPHISNMLATVGTDEYCKIWDISTSEPKMVAKRNLKQGELFSVQFYDDIAWVLAAGGSKGEVAIWDTEESEILEKHFKPFLSDKAPREPNAVEDDGNADFEDMDSSDEEVVKAQKKKKKDKK